ncbi:MAG: CBS domain-containing protein [Ignavibacteria bacterium]|nr:CBS domain-containing protein [Ignavibacteria bacterium]
MLSTVKQLIADRPVYTVEKGSTVRLAAEFMAEQNIGATPVMDGDRLIGIFSERDVINRVVAKGLDPSNTTVNQVMTTDLIVASVEETYESCLKKMRRAGIRHLPVVDADKLVGFISLRDLLQIDISEKDDKLEFLNSYMFHVSPEIEKKYTTQKKS